MFSSKALYFTFFLISSLSSVDMGSLLFHGNCTTCHFETKTVSAPSVVDFRENYIRAFPIREDFIKYMSAWVVKPNKESSIMIDAIGKYELMPELGFDLSTLEEITSYIYDTDFTKDHECP